MELLDQLKQRSGIQDNPDQEGLDLFAELIIQECLKVIDSSCTNISLGDSIIEHFGLR